MTNNIKQKLKQWIRDNISSLGINDYQIKDISSGESNYVLKVFNTNNSIIVRTNKPPATDRTIEYAKVLRFLDKYIENVPKLLYYKESTSVGQPVIVEEFVGKGKFDEKKITPKLAEQLAQMLAEIHKVSLGNYNKYFEKKEPEQESLYDYLTGLFTQYSKEPYERYLKTINKPDKRIIHLFEKQKALLKESKLKNIAIQKTLIHGDLSGNIRIAKDKLFLIDWEIAHINSPVMELLFFFDHSPMSRQQKQLVYNAYRKHNPKFQFEESKEIILRIMRFEDLAWAARRLAHAEKTQSNRFDYFRNLVEKRIHRLEKVLKTD